MEDQPLEQMEEAMPSTVLEDWRSFTLDHINRLIAVSTHRPPNIGYLVWTKSSHDTARILRDIDALKARGIRHIRTGISWAEWIDQDGEAWIKWYIEEYAKHFEVLPCLTFTPPDLAEIPQVNAPPRDLTLYAHFVNEVIHELGHCFHYVELWNEWNLNTDWLSKEKDTDPEYQKFTTMIAPAARVARELGKKVVLGGASKANLQTLKWLRVFRERGLSEVIDVLGFHNLRGTWSDDTPSPAMQEQAKSLQEAWKRPIPVWLTEYGFPVTSEGGNFDLHMLEQMQVALFAYAVYCCLTETLERVYWYTLRDEVHTSLRMATTGWEDKLQFFFGDITEEGKLRLLSKLLLEGGPMYVLRYAVENRLMHLVDAASLGRKLKF